MPVLFGSEVQVEYARVQHDPIAQSRKARIFKMSHNIITTKHVRNFIGYGKPSPATDLQFYGVNTQWMSVDGVSVPGTSKEPMYHVDPHNIGKYVRVGEMIGPPEGVTGTLTIRERIGVVPKHLGELGCEFNLWMVTGNCRDLSDFASGWDSYVHVVGGNTVTSTDLGARTTFDEDAPLAASVEFASQYSYAMGAITLRSIGDLSTFGPVGDVVFAPPSSQCGCSGAGDGTRWLYAVTTPIADIGQYGVTAAAVLLSTNGGATWGNVAITGIGLNETPLQIEVIGNRLVILTDGAAYYHARIGETGVPDAFTKVTAGFVVGREPMAMFSLGPTETFFVGKLGAVYKSESITTGVQYLDSIAAGSLTCISGDQYGTMAIGGMNGALFTSTDRGASWQAVTATMAPVAPSIETVAVTGGQLWVGTSTGVVYWSGSFGNGKNYDFAYEPARAWRTIAVPGTALTAVVEITFPTPERGYILGTVSGGAGRILTTLDGGRHWSDDNPAIMDLPSNTALRSLAVPARAALQNAANTLLIGGSASGGGLVVHGAATQL